MTKPTQKSFSEQGVFYTKKVGTTTYIINVHYPEHEQESATEKLLRIIQADIAKGDAAC